MDQAISAKAGIDIQANRKLLKRELTLLPLFGLIYFTVCGGSFGAEPMVGLSGPGLAIVLFFITPLLFSIPNMLMVREMNSMMPVEGGYYHWLKKAFGPFTGFMGGWMNWVVSWVDVSIYPIWAAYYLGFFIKPIAEGITIGGIALDSIWVSWIVSLILIWGISYLNIRGARLTGLTTSWLSVVMIIPLVLMSIVGIYNWISSGTTISLPFLAGGQEVNANNIFSALSVGLFVAMWNFMGWELPTAAGDEIVKPKRTYPLAMALVLVAAIATYAIPTVSGLYGGAGADGKYLVWGVEEANTGEGIGPVLAENGVTDQQLSDWGVDPTSSYGWEFNNIAQQVGDRAAGAAGSPFGLALGGLVTLAGVLSMIGLFIGNGLGGTRVPFAMAEDGMMPKFLVKVHPRYGTPWVSIVICGIIFSIFSLVLNFEDLVVIDVFLNGVVLMAEFLALWKLRIAMPDIPRDKAPGGWIGLGLITLAPFLLIILAVYSQYRDYGLSSLGLAAIATAIGALFYFPIRKWIKPGVPDIDPFQAEAAEAG